MNVSDSGTVTSRLRSSRCTLLSLTVRTAYAALLAPMLLKRYAHLKRMRDGLDLQQIPQEDDTVSMSTSTTATTTTTTTTVEAARTTKSHFASMEESLDVSDFTGASRGYAF